MCSPRVMRVFQHNTVFKKEASSSTQRSVNYIYNSSSTQCSLRAISRNSIFYIQHGLVYNFSSKQCSFRSVVLKSRQLFNTLQSSKKKPALPHNAALIIYTTVLPHNAVFELFHTIHFFTLSMAWYTLFFPNNVVFEV